MRKLASISSFVNETEELTSKEMGMVMGGKALEESSSYCYEDTCINNTCDTTYTICHDKGGVETSETTTVMHGQC